MNPPDLTALWNSPANRPAPDAWDSLAATTRARQLRRRRLFLGVLIPASFWTILLVVWLAVRWGGGQGPDLRREWAAPVLLALQMAAVAHFWVLHLKSGRPPAVAGKDIQTGLRFLFLENRRAGLRLKIIASLLLITAAAMPLVVKQLQAAGKAGAEIQGPFLFGVPGIAGLVIVAMVWHWRKVLAPEGRALNEQLAQIREPFIAPA